MLDVLMVTPPSRAQVYQALSNEFAAIEPPVASGLIATYVRRAGFDVAMLDAEAEGLTHEQTADRIAGLAPRLAVFMICGQQPSASTQCMPGGRKACEALDELTRGAIPTLVVGTHPSALPERTLREEPYAYVCRGEGPVTVARLAAALKNGGDLRAVPGLWYRDADGTIRHNAPARLLDDLDDELAGQAWDLLDMSLYRSHNWHSFDKPADRMRYASLQTSLGCPFKCSFCCINAPFGTNTLRCWSPDNVIAQIDVLVERYGIRNIKIHDEMFVLNPKHVMGIADRIIERGYDLNFWAYARIDTLQNEAMLTRLKRAGFNWLAIGIESGSRFVRDGVTKGRFDNDRSRRSSTACAITASTWRRTTSSACRTTRSPPCARRWTWRWRSTRHGRTSIRQWPTPARSSIRSPRTGAGACRTILAARGGLATHSTPTTAYRCRPRPWRRPRSSPSATRRSTSTSATHPT